MKLAISILFILLAGIKAQSQVSGIEVGAINYGGTGCKAGSVELASRDQLGVLNLKAFSLAAKKDVLSRKACDIAIPISVSPGLQVAVGPVAETKAQVNLPSASVLTINQELFFVGSSGKGKSSTVKGPKAGQVKLQNPVILKDLVWSACGQSTTLRLHMTANLQTSKKAATAQIQSLQILKNNRLYWRNCQ